MMLRKRRPAQPAPQPETTKPAWHAHLDSEERPSREDLAAGHNVFDSVLEPVPLPRRLRGRRRPPRDKMS